MGFRLTVLVLALMLVPAGVHAASPAPNGTYAGTIGSYPIVAELGPSYDFHIPADGKTTFGGQYFYRSQGQGIELEGKVRADGSIIVSEMKADGAGGVTSTGDVWRVRLSGTGVSGTWSGAHATLPIALARIGGAARGDDPEQHSTDRFHRELVQTTLARGQPQSLGGITYVTVSDRRFSLSSIVLSSGPSASVMAAANGTLSRDFALQRAVAYDCLIRARSYGTGLGLYELKTRVAYAGVSALTLDRRGRYYCGGAYPSDNIAPLTLDLRDGSEVDWSHAIADRAGVTAAYAHEVKTVWKKSGRSDCTSGPAMVPDEYVYEIVPGGLLVHGLLPHVVAECEADVVIPSGRARSLLAPNARAVLPSLAAM
jgi:hypothetical protein